MNFLHPFPVGNCPIKERAHVYFATFVHSEKSRIAACSQNSVTACHEGYCRVAKGSEKGNQNYDEAVKHPKRRVATFATF